MFYLTIIFGGSNINTGELAFYLIQPFSLNHILTGVVRVELNTYDVLDIICFSCRLTLHPLCHVIQEADPYEYIIGLACSLPSTWVWPMGSTIKKSEGKSKVRLSVSCLVSCLQPRVSFPIGLFSSPSCFHLQVSIYSLLLPIKLVFSCW